MEFEIEPAQRITRLPPYLFGRLNALKLAKRQAGIRGGVRKSAVYGAYQYQYAGTGRLGYNAYSGRKTESTRRQITTEENAKATKVRFESWKEIEDSTADIRRKMTQKYRLEF